MIVINFISCLDHKTIEEVLETVDKTVLGMFITIIIILP